MIEKEPPVTGLLSPGCHQITCIHLTQQGNVEPEPMHSRQLYLQYLDMTDCYALEDQGLKVIVKNCPQLLHLYLRRCINITGEFPGLCLACQFIKR